MKGHVRQADAGCKLCPGLTHGYGRHWGTVDCCEQQGIVGQFPDTELHPQFQLSLAVIA
jgi:hypothetical protein